MNRRDYPSYGKSQREARERERARRIAAGTYYPRGANPTGLANLCRGRSDANWTAKALWQLRHDYAQCPDALAWINAHASEITADMCDRIDKCLFTAITLDVIREAGR